MMKRNKGKGEKVSNETIFCGEERGGKNKGKKVKGTAGEEKGAV